MLGNPGLFRWERDGPSGLPGGLGARIAPGKVHCYLLRIALVGRGFSGGQGGRKRHGLFEGQMDTKQVYHCGAQVPQRSWEFGWGLREKGP